MAESKIAGVKGYYFFPPKETNSWRICNSGCVFFYYPLIAIEQQFGTSDGISDEPLWHLSSGAGKEPKK